MWMTSNRRAFPYSILGITSPERRVPGAHPTAWLFARRCARPPTIIALPGATPERRTQALELARQSRLPVLTVPSRSELHAQPVRAEVPTREDER